MTIISNQPVLELTDKTLTLFPNSRSLIGWKMTTSFRYGWLGLSNRVWSKKLQRCFAWLCSIKPEKHKFDEISKLMTLVPFQNGTKFVSKFIFRNSRTIFVKRLFVKILQKHIFKQKWKIVVRKWFEFFSKIAK